MHRQLDLDQRDLTDPNGQGLSAATTFPDSPLPRPSEKCGRRDGELTLAASATGGRGHAARPAGNLDRIERRRASWRRSSAKRRREHPDLVRESNQRNREKYPERARARALVNAHVIRGKLVAPDACEGCGGPGGRDRLQKHHPDYRQPRLIQWLCRACHWATHRQEVARV